jgi:hypothetical protein
MSGRRRLALRAGSGVVWVTLTGLSVRPAAAPARTASRASKGSAPRHAPAIMRSVSATGERSQDACGASGERRPRRRAAPRPRGCGGACARRGGPGSVLTLGCVAATAGVVNAAYYDVAHVTRTFGLGASGLLFLEGVVDFLDAHAVTARLFNDDELGGYLLWRDYPKRHVSIDGRVQVYPEHLYSRINRTGLRSRKAGEPSWSSRSVSRRGGRRAVANEVPQCGCRYRREPLYSMPDPIRHMMWSPTAPAPLP